MRILLTAATGYIAQRLISVLLNRGNEVICCVRDYCRFNSEKYGSSALSFVEVDFLKPETLQNVPSENRTGIDHRTFIFFWHLLFKIRY